jgi:hypothetical protein
VEAGEGDEFVRHTPSLPEYWALADCVAIVNGAHKPELHTENALAGTSPAGRRIADASSPEHAAALSGSIFMARRIIGWIRA